MELRVIGLGVNLREGGMGGRIRRGRGVTSENAIDMGK